jgi:hypothetical protein
MESTTKTVQIMGGAHISGRRRSKKADKGQKGGSNQEVTITRSELQSRLTPQPSGYTSPSPATTGSSFKTAFDPLLTPTQKNQPVPVSVSGPPVVPLGQAGGKVKLDKSPTAKKVRLEPKKDLKDLPTNSKKKKTRKITMGLVSLKKRQTRAKKISEKVKEMPLEQLRKHLIEKNLIKATSKAPESILRQIAADSQIVSDGI